MRLTALATGLLALALSTSAFAAASYGGGGQRGDQSNGVQTSRSSSGGELFVPQCYPTGISHVVRCSTPVLIPVAGGDSCYCSDVKVRTSKGLVTEKRCSSERLAGVAQKKVPVAQCETTRRW